MTHLIIFDRAVYPTVSYYVSEPWMLRDGSEEYTGGFDSDISKAITFDNPVLAHLARRRLEAMYADIPAKMKVISMPTKELFKAKLK